MTKAASREVFDDQGESRGWLDPDNRLNDLTGREWRFWTRSVITKPYPANGVQSVGHDLRREHGGEKPPHLCADLVRAFTKEDARVLDPFMGTGGSLLGAVLAGREAVGIDLEPRWIEIYQQVCERESIAVQPTVQGDAAAVLRDGHPALSEPFDMVLTDVPYWNMDKARRSPGTWKRVGQTARPKRQSRLSRFQQRRYDSKQQWLDEMVAVLGQAAEHLRPSAYLLAFVGDMYQEGEYHNLGADLASALKAARKDLVQKANLIWYDPSKTLHIYGYRYAFIPSITHQNILVFRRETG